MARHTWLPLPEDLSELLFKKLSFLSLGVCCGVLLWGRSPVGVMGPVPAQCLDTLAMHT